LHAYSKTTFQFRRGFRKVDWMTSLRGSGDLCLMVSKSCSAGCRPRPAGPLGRCIMNRLSRRRASAPPPRPLSLLLLGDELSYVLLELLRVRCPRPSRPGRHVLLVYGGEKLAHAVAQRAARCRISPPQVGARPVLHATLRLPYLSSLSAPFSSRRRNP